MMLKNSVFSDFSVVKKTTEYADNAERISLLRFLRSQKNYGLC